MDKTKEDFTEDEIKIFNEKCVLENKEQCISFIGFKEAKKGVVAKIEAYIGLADDVLNDLALIKDSEKNEEIKKHIAKLEEDKKTLFDNKKHALKAETPIQIKIVIEEAEKNFHADYRTGKWKLKKDIYEEETEEEIYERVKNYFLDDQKYIYDFLIKKGISQKDILDNMKDTVLFKNVFTQEELERKLEETLEKNLSKKAVEENRIFFTEKGAIYTPIIIVNTYDNN